MNLLRSLSDALVTLVARAAPAVAGIRHRGGQGSALVLAPDGWLLTNAHVLRAGREVRVDFAGGEDAKGEVIGTDARTDLGVVRVAARDLAALPLADTGRIQVGQLVVAIGNPLRFDRSVSLGVVSALDRSLPAGDGSVLEGLVQTDAAINPGNSGGPLVDAEGGVVGINTAVIPFAQGIGFAVPARTAHWVAAVLMRHGTIDRPVLGVTARGVDLATALAKDFGQPRGLLVYRVAPSSPAATAGLQDGDLLLTANDSVLGCVDDLQRVLVLASEPGIRLDVLRSGRRHTIVAHPAMTAALT
jgi:S1-C subfamily serine protease